MTKTTLDEIRTIIAGNDELIDRAKVILRAAPNFTSVPDEQYVRLSIEGDVATLTWPESHSGYYDSCSLEEQSQNFPAELLFMTLAESAVWSTEQRRIYDERQIAIRAEAGRLQVEKTRRDEIRMLATLKAKYDV